MAAALYLGEEKQQRRMWAHAEGVTGSDEEDEDEPVAPGVEDEWERLVAPWEDPDWAPF